jgi:hypothetical protein
MKTQAIALPLAAFILLASNQVLAWGAEGHRISGDIAQQLLTPNASQAVEKILPGANFAKLSTWMDEHKLELKHSLPGSDKWHYQDLPVCDAVVEDSCPQGNCAGEKIEVYRKVLADSGASTDARAQALTFLIHLVGDIHQPLHAADNLDRGGNLVKVSLPTPLQRSENLHALWDSTLVARAVNGAEDWSARARQVNAEHLPAWQQGSTEQWILESNQLARLNVYPKLPDFQCGQVPHRVQSLDQAYLDQGQPVVAEQLVKAGARIAQVINNALDPGSVNLEE